ncbi:MAG: phosphatidate cytidylyltransferase [Thiomargarita sp.]|nr:phosphatidate cytidylyltransferase [Thiomargarita sp.]
MLKQRLLTAIILIPVTIWIILFAEYFMFAAFISLFVILAAWEWARLCGWNTSLSRGIYSLFIASILALTYWKWHSNIAHIFDILLLTSVCWLFAGIWIIIYNKQLVKLPNIPIFKGGLGFIILVPAWMALLLLRSEGNGKWVLFLLVLIWTADSGAYFAGKRWGKTKLAVNISPGKTWEGVIGAMLASSILSVIYINLFPANSLIFSLLFVLLCLITVVFSILGDLVESLFKRQVGVKDSGNLLPGHGGILDRIDSITAAAPIFVMGLALLARY